jgi:hypothetical protein
MSLEELQRLQEFNVENIPIDHKDITETIAGVVFMMGQQLNELHKKVAEVVPVEALAKNWTRCQYPVHQHTLPTGDDEVVLVELRVHPKPFGFWSNLSGRAWFLSRWSNYPRASSRGD